MIKFHHTFKTLPSIFHSPSVAIHFSNPKLIHFNHQLSQELGLDFSFYSEEDLAKTFTGNLVLNGSEPISLAYAGHQFGHFVPQLGDGRAMLLGEIIDSHGKRFDIQLKGMGPTKFSRNGDGKSALGPVIREYLLSEAMHELGVPTTRALAAVSTGDFVYRETALPGAVFTRIASSHLRIGTFQYASAQGDTSSLKALFDYAILRHYPEIKNQENTPLLFLQKVAESQIKLIAHWMSLGFIHGVMNTDNMTISGETIDYGPCAFMDQFNFNQVYSFIDRNGRYAYGNQPSILLWNLSRLADCLIPLIETDEKTAIAMLNRELNIIPEKFLQEFNQRIAAKLGLKYQMGDDEMIQTWLEYLESEKLDFTLSFRKLADIIETSDSAFFKKTDLFNKFESLWRPRLADISALKEKMNSLNPFFIPRNHHIEKAIQDAILGNFSTFHELHAVLSKPFEEQPRWAHYASPPTEEEKIKNTFCGT